MERIIVLKKELDDSVDQMLNLYSEVLGVRDFSQEDNQNILKLQKKCRELRSKINDLSNS